MVLKILMVDDHALILEGYKTVLKLNQKQYDIQATLAYNCQEAHNIICNPKNSVAFDVVFLDYSLPSFSAQKIENGEDLGILVRKFMSKTKIIMFTSHFDSIKIYNLFFKLQPEGILIKSDIEPEELFEILEKILNGENHYTPLALSCINEPLFLKGKITSVDRQIIAYMALGYKIETMAEKLNLSDDAIKKRKRKIKELLNINDYGDEQLLKSCRYLNLLPF